ncbi:hypothetical protein SKAU_G00181570 [Synaphobranchus kaupii]|uniref:Dual specificity protein phosphatase n=1 Tax=Synaphobranchus kaupii TaxID=118154 RepID=A0A9Q1FMV7_SYNKA|nr:hypothetical protein SKAU_G00181570 [Synaphobranchus kaupii]
MSTRVSRLTPAPAFQHFEKRSQAGPRQRLNAPRRLGDVFIPGRMDPRKSQRDQEGYHTPSVPELQLLLLENISPRGPVNEVWPNLYIGNAATARDKSTLFNMRITHIVNAAHGPYHVNTGARFYRDMYVDYYGVEADDSADFNLSLFFHPVAKFIRAALSQRGK